MSIVKLIAVDAAACSQRNCRDPQRPLSRELCSAREQILALNIESLVAIPLLDAGEQSGILILEQTAPRAVAAN